MVKMSNSLRLTRLHIKYNVIIDLFRYAFENLPTPQVQGLIDFVDLNVASVGIANVTFIDDVGKRVVFVVNTPDHVLEY